MAGNPTTQTLTAATPLTVSLTGEWTYVRVIPVSVTDHVWLTVDGSTPTAGADGVILCPSKASTTVKVPWAAGATVVKVLSTLGGTCYIEGIRDPEDDEGDVRRFSVM